MHFKVMHHSDNPMLPRNDFQNAKLNSTRLSQRMLEI